MRWWRCVVAWSAGLTTSSGPMTPSLAPLIVIGLPMIKFTHSSGLSRLTSNFSMHDVICMLAMQARWVEPRWYYVCLHK